MRLANNIFHEIFCLGASNQLKRMREMDENRSSVPFDPILKLSQNRTADHKIIRNGSTQNQRIFNGNHRMESIGIWYIIYIHIFIVMSNS